MTDLGAFTSYDLGRVLEALRAARAEHPDQPPNHAFRAACIDLLPFDHRWRECWADPTFLPRYQWLRAALAIADSADLLKPIARLEQLVADAIAADAANDDPDARSRPPHAQPRSRPARKEPLMQRSTPRRYLVPTWLLVLIALAALITLILMPAPSYASAPTAFTVTPAGITLDRPFADNGHINAETPAGTVNLHAEAKCRTTPAPPECSPRMITAAQLIGATEIPWSAFGYTGCEPVSWVQAWYADYHFGAADEPAVIVAPCSSTPPVDEEPPTEEQPPVVVTPPATVEVAWAMPTGSGPCPVGPTGTTGCDNTGWPQTYLPDPELALCGLWIQHDIYLVDEAARYTADGILTNGEDHRTDTQRGAISWRFTYTGDCPPPTSPAPPITPEQPPAPTAALAATGSSETPALPIAAALLIAGVILGGARLLSANRRRG